MYKCSYHRGKDGQLACSSAVWIWRMSVCWGNTYVWERNKGNIGWLLMYSFKCSEQDPYMCHKRFYKDAYVRNINRNVQKLHIADSLQDLMFYAQGLLLEYSHMCRNSCWWSCCAKMSEVWGPIFLYRTNWIDGFIVLKMIQRLCPPFTRSTKKKLFKDMVYAYGLNMSVELSLQILHEYRYNLLIIIINLKFGSLNINVLVVADVCNVDFKGKHL